MNRHLAPAIFLVAFALGPALAPVAAADVGAIMQVKITPEVGKYCHVVRLAGGWKIKPVDDLGQRAILELGPWEYEFRKSRSAAPEEFLVGIFSTQVDHRYDSMNHYRVNLSDRKAKAVAVSEQEWRAATVVPLARKFQNFGPAVGQQLPITFNGHQFMKSGAIWDGPEVSRLSPDSAWLVLQSWTSKGTSKVTLRDLYSIFMDVFNANTGEKILTIMGPYSAYSSDASSGLGETAWLTSRYFVAPLGEPLDRCLVCEFGAPNPKGGPKSGP